jgi:glycerol uptake facilitator-like aquaporin
MGGKYVTYAGRPFVIFGMLFIIIALGGRTHNVALNPARLVAPAVVGQMYGGAQGTLDAT